MNNEYDSAVGDDITRMRKINGVKAVVARVSSTGDRNIFVSQRECSWF